MFIFLNVATSFHLARGVVDKILIPVGCVIRHHRKHDDVDSKENEDEVETHKDDRLGFGFLCTNFVDREPKEANPDRLDAGDRTK